MGVIGGGVMYGAEITDRGALGYFDPYLDCSAALGVSEATYALR
jgi:hypothetical protein